MSPGARRRKAGALARCLARLNALDASLARLAPPNPRREEDGVFERVWAAVVYAPQREEEQRRRLQYQLTVQRREAQSLCDKLGCWRLKHANGQWQVFKTVYAETGATQTEHRVTDFLKG